MMFKQSHPAFLHILEDQISDLLRMYEPRINLNGVMVYFKNQMDEDKGIITVEISFSTLELGSSVAVFQLERTR